MKMHQALEISPRTQVLAVVKNILYSGSIAIVVVEDDSDNMFKLFGDIRMTESLVEYIGGEVMLFINHSTDWSWLPVREFAKA